MPQFSLVQLVLLVGIPLLFAITVHEVAHGWVANRLGDPTARMLGRLTLNPIKHIDPLGTIVIPALLLIVHAPIMFGWARPVPITPQNFKQPRLGMAWVAAAGPGSNLLMACIWLAIAWVAVALSAQAPFIAPLYWMGQFGVYINIALGVLNIFPIPPLDGSRILAGFLPQKGARVLYRIEPYGLFVVAILLWTGVLTAVLAPIIFGFSRVMISLAGLQPVL